jgi:serine/threonine protein kinase
MYENIEIEKYNIIVMEYINAKDLFYILSDTNKYIKLQEKEKMIEQIILGLEYLHNKGIAHMDIKIENVLYNTLSKNIKIIDFGISLIYKDKTKTYLYQVDKNNINWYYPPECYLQKTMYIRPEKIDIWCLGLLIYNIIYQVNAWDESNYQCKYYVNYKKTGMFIRKLKRQKKQIEKDIDEFIREILETDMRKRKSIYYVKLSFNVYKIKQMMQII